MIAFLSNTNHKLGVISLLNDISDSAYSPLNEKAIETATEVGTVEIKREKKKNSFVNAYESIQKDMDRGKLGFKRKFVRC